MNPTLATATSCRGPRKVWAWVARLVRIEPIWVEMSSWSKPSDRSQSEMGSMRATRSCWNWSRFFRNSVVEANRADAAATTRPNATMATEP